MPNPKILRALVNVEANTLEVVLERDVTDSVTGATDRQSATVTGPLDQLAALASLRTNVVAWVKAQTGYGGSIGVAAPPTP